MANKAKILDKIKRNLDMLGVTAVRGAEDVTITGVMVITCEDASIQSPMGGVSDASAPFLGIGVAAPVTIQIQGDTGNDDLEDIIPDEDALKALRVCCGFANQVTILGADDAVLATLPGSPDLHGMGQ